MVRRVCAPVLEGTPVWGGRGFSEREREEYIVGFSDERGHRRVIDPVLLGWMMRGEGEDEGAMLARWLEVVRDDGGEGALADGNGGLVPRLFERGVEIWTEAELCALHALGHLARIDSRQTSRLERATAWAMRELQPDNGTNHPWAFHVFARRWCERGEHEARMYAEQLVHNCVVQTGRPDRFSACVLWDSARALRG